MSEEYKRKLKMARELLQIATYDKSPRSKDLESERWKVLKKKQGTL